MQKRKCINNEMTIIVSSWDGARELWKPFSETFDFYWKDCPYEKVLLTQNEKAIRMEYTFNRIIGIESANQEPIKRIRLALNEISSEFIMLMCDDYFLKSYCDSEEIHNICKKMKNEGIVDLHFSNKKANGHKEASYKALRSDAFIISGGHVCIYNRKFLISLTDSFIDKSMRGFEVSSSAFIRSCENTYNIMLIDGSSFQCYHCVLENYWRVIPYLWIKKFDKKISFNNYKRPNIFHSILSAIKAIVFNIFYLFFNEWYKNWAKKKYQNR